MTQKFQVILTLSVGVHKKKGLRDDATKEVKTVMKLLKNECLIPYGLYAFFEEEPNLKEIDLNRIGIKEVKRIS